MDGDMVVGRHGIGEAIGVECVVTHVGSCKGMLRLDSWMYLLAVDNEKNTVEVGR